MPSTYFISSDDDYLCANAAREIFEKLCADVNDDMSKEIIDCSASNSGEIVDACRRAMEGAATMSLFGGKKVVWMRGVNFFADSRAAKSEDGKKAISGLLDFLEKLDENVASVVISASPVDRRGALFKRLKAFAQSTDFKIDDSSQAAAELLQIKAKELNVGFAPGAAETLVSIVAGNPRMAVEELEKLAAYVGFGGKNISQKDVVEMVPVFGEGDFFEIAEAFYSGNLDTALRSLRRYFFTNKNASARPIISVLQKQNALLIQIRALMEDGVFRKSPTGIRKAEIEAAAEKYAEIFSDYSNKSAYCIFSQNAWYAGAKLAPLAANISLKKLMLFQTLTARCFEELISRPGDEESVVRDLFVRCLSAS